jgi:hypothetical protein
MLAKRVWLASSVIAWAFALLITATISHAQVSYTTTWVGNSYSTIPTYVGNAMRSMWVAPEGVVYTASDWDESQGGINVYQNGHKINTFAAHGEEQGGAISGDAADLFSALQFNTTLGGSGFIGRYNRSTGTRDLTWSASSDTTERRADVITGIADTGTLAYLSDHPDNLVRCYTTVGVCQSDWSLTDPGAIAVDGSGNIWVASAIAAWVSTSSPRLSYAGLQIAFAFYLINLSEFTIQTSLTVARDRAIGVLLGTSMMWLVFERFYGRPAADEMVRIFISNLRQMTELIRITNTGVDAATIVKIRRQRDQIYRQFEDVTAQTDAVPFETGPARAGHMAARDRIRRWQAGAPHPLSS